MKNKSILIKSLSGAIIFSIGFVITFLLFQKYNFFDLGNRSFKSIVMEGLITGVLFFLFMVVIYSMKRAGIKNRQ
jgi:hypothetical protein